MPALTDVEGLPVADPEGRELGGVEHVLFHPSEPRAVGLQVAIPPLLFLIDRKPRYLPLRPGMLAYCGEAKLVLWPEAKLPRRKAAEKELGYSFDETVIWRNMEVDLETGERVGLVGDVVFSRKTGKVLRMMLSEGSLSDIAVGQREIPGELVEGFLDGAVRIDPSFREYAASGGLAAASAKGIAYTRHGVDKAADATLAAGVAGLGAVERSFRTGIGAKAMRGLRRAGKRARKAIDGES